MAEIISSNSTAGSSPMTSEDLTDLFPQYVFIGETANSTKEFREFSVLIPSEARHGSVKMVDISSFSEAQVERLTKEMNQYVMLKHHSLVGTRKFWRHENYLFILSGEVHGTRLDKLIDEGRFSLKRTLEVSIQVAAMLEYLHEQKVHHCGICPQAIYVDPHYALSIEPGYFVSALVDMKMGTFDYPDFKGFVTKTSADDAVISPIVADINSLGALVCYLSTGYTPDLMASSSWESYGLDNKLYELVARAVGHEDYHYFTRIDEVVDILEAVQSSNFSTNSIGKACMKTKLNRLTATQIWTPEVANLNSAGEPLDALEDTGETLFNDRYRMKDCVEITPVKKVFNAEDTTMENRKVWMHLHDFDGDPQWSFDFRTLAQKLYSIQHPHICQVHDFALLEDVGYIATHRELGEYLTHFTHRHRFSWNDITAFVQQVGGALAVALQSGCQCYFLSPETIAVYGNREGDYFYRLMSVGYSEVLAMGEEDDFLNTFNARQPKWLLPTLKKQEFVGFKTTQMIFGNIALQLICRYHPVENASHEECQSFHKIDSEEKVKQHASGLSPKVQKWLSTLLHIDEEKRFENPQMMLMAFASALTEGENYV